MFCTIFASIVLQARLLKDYRIILDAHASRRNRTLSVLPGIDAGDQIILDNKGNIVSKVYAYYTSTHSR